MTRQRNPNHSAEAPTRPPRALRLRPSLIQRTRRERKSFNGALVASVLVHALLLSQLVGGEGQGPAGFVLPWQARRVQVPDVQVVLAPLPAASAESVAPTAAVPVQRASIRPPPANAPAPVPPAPPAAPPAPPAPPAPRPRSPVVVDVPERAPAPPPPVPVSVSVPVPVPVPSPKPAVLTAAPSDVPTPVVPAAVAPAATTAVESGASSPDPVALAARETAQEAQRQEAARQATARAETARLDAERQESARQAAAAQLEAQRQEAARQTAEAARQTAARAEVARLEAERQETARKAAAQQEATRAQAAQEAAAAAAAAVAKREALLRAIGRQLDEENARRDTARASSTLPLSLSTARRIRLWGHTNPNAELVEYAQAWASKIHLNAAPDMVRDAAKRPHTPPTVVVALRSDGSVESVEFSVSSGVPEVDATIRRIIESQRPYPAFPPALAREFDVVEIRRTWHFDGAVRLH